MEYIDITTNLLYNEEKDKTEGVFYNIEIGRLNPFRYRGYYYDIESSLYYLNTRYYDPTIGRFINADEITILDETQSQIHGLNLYMYCGNNPVGMIDPSGMLPEWLKWLSVGLAVVGAILVVGAITVLTAGVGTATLMGSIAVGSSYGILIGAGVGVVTGAVIGGVTTGTWEGAFVGAGIGLGAGAIIGGVIGGSVAGGRVMNASKSWSGTMSKGEWITPYKNMARHYKKHVINPGRKGISKNLVKYTKDAKELWKSSGGVGKLLESGNIKIRMIKKGPQGIYDLVGKILSFLYK